MDLYYQQFKSDEDFFEVEHFEYLNGVVYAKLLQEEYERSYQKSLAETGRGYATISPQWYIEETVKVTTSDMGDAEIVMKDCPFTFRFDRSNTAIQGIYPIKGKCKDFISINIDERFKFDGLPKSTVVYWYPVSNKIILHNLSCGLKEAKIIYIPGLKAGSDKCGISDGMEYDVINGTLDLMKRAKQGEVVDMTNNNNPNKALETEISAKFAR